MPKCFDRPSPGRYECHMIRHSSRPRKTVDDYKNLPDEVRAELIDGELFISPSPKELHQRIIGNLYQELGRFVDSTGAGAVYMAPFDVHLPSADIVQPDVLYVSRANASIIQEWIRGVPDLVIEVLSAENPERDRIVKRDLYARNGVREYWLVDGGTKSVEIFRLEGRVYAPAGCFELTDPIESALLRDLRLPVQDVFA